MSKKTIRQHYVFQAYLKSWAYEDNRLWCVINNKVVSSSTKDVCVHNNFYRIEPLNTDEMKIVKNLSAVFNNSGQISIQQHINDSNAVLSMSSLTNDLERLFSKAIKGEKEKFLLQTQIKEMKETIDVARNNIYEEYYCEFENDLLAAIKNGLDSKPLYDNEETKKHLILSLCVQYFRTKRMRDTAAKLVKECIDYNKISESAIAIDKIASYLLWPMSELMADALINNGFVVYTANNSTEFDLITSDQPIINILADYSTEEEPFDLELYYPISPKMAIFVSNNSKREINTYDTVIEFNEKMIKASTNVIISNSENQAKSISENI